MNNIFWIKIKILYVFIIISIVGLLPRFVFASTAEQPKIKLQVPLLDYKDATNIAEYIVKIYQALLYILIPLAIVMIIWGGILWILSAGDKNLIGKAKERIKYGIIGILIMLFSYLLLFTIGGGSGSSGGGSGLLDFKPPEVENIEMIPTEFINNETGKDACSPGKPGCGSGTSYNNFNNSNFLIHTANAAKANVPLIKQWTPDDVGNTPFGCCGTLAKSGCGIAALTMVLKYYNLDTNIKQVARLASAYGYRKCPANCQNITDCPQCQGTKYDLFVNPASQNYGQSKVLNLVQNSKGNLTPFKGEILTSKSETGVATSTGISTKKIILDHLSQSHPLIVVVSGPARITTVGHFIVLTGCDGCDKNEKAKIYINDPNRENFDMTQAELFSNLKAAFYIHP